MKEIVIDSQVYGLKTCLVDDEDYEWILAMGSVAATPYGYANMYIRGSKPRTQKHLHRVIFERYNIDIEGKDIDHINMNKMDNRKENLRVCSRSQNKGNVKKPRGKKNASQYKGVTLGYGKWRTLITKDGHVESLSTYETERQAAIAYDIRAKELFGEFAQINIPDASPEEISTVIIRQKSQKRYMNTTSRYFGISKNQYGYYFRVQRNDGRRFVQNGFDTELNAAQARNQYIEDNKLLCKKTIL